MPLVLYGAKSLGRPSHQTITRQPLFQGIVYSRQINDQPRPQVIHIVDIDLTTPGLIPFVTPGYEGAIPQRGGAIPQETLAQRTSDMVQTHGLQLAVNANFFYPFREVTPWDYGPRPGQPVNVVGLAMSDGKIVSMAEASRISLCFIDQKATIRPDGDCPHGRQAVAGGLLMLENGQLTKAAQTHILEATGKPYPFTIVALDASGTRLWIVLVDGKQPLYTEGMTLREATDLLQGLGANTALQLDGGGSTTLAMATPTGAKVLNVPIHAKVPGQERPVANHLGFFARPLAVDK